MELDPGQVRSLVQELDGLGFIPPTTDWLDSVGKAKFRKFTVQWPYQTRLIDIDVFLALDDFSRSALSRRRSVELDVGFATHVLMPEDLLIHKLIAWRKKDEVAVRRLLTVQRDLEWSYVRKWAARFQVENRLSEALRQARIPEPPA